MTNDQLVPTTSCKFCGVPHKPGHNDCAYYPNYGTEDYRIKREAEKAARTARTA